MAVPFRHCRLPRVLHTGTQSPTAVIDSDFVKATLEKTHLVYDAGGDQHYDTISALHKSLRGSDVDASLYWLARMVEGGEDPKFIARCVCVSVCLCLCVT